MANRNITIPIGSVFGRITVMNQIIGPHGGYRFICRCSCGEELNLVAHDLLKAGKKSCGCWFNEIRTKRKRTHGHTNRNWTSGTYLSWRDMHIRCSDRCKDKRNRKHYYLRGIRVCERWGDFLNFLADMGERPEGTSLDRIDNNGDYEPGNCRWATAVQQARNTSKTRRIAYGGETKCLTEWAKELGISPNALAARIARHGSEKAIAAGSRKTRHNFPK